MTKDKSILINNIYHMLSYAFQTLKQETYEDVAVESFDEMYNLLAAILAKGIGLQLKQGLYREYISHQEELTVMRGKINMPGTIKNKLLHKQVLTCDFDELSENNMLNQILKTTVMLLLRNGKVKAKYKDDLKKKMLYFSNVDSIEPTEIKWSSIRFQRNNQTYRMLVSICQLIIEGMLLYAKTEEEIQPDNVYQMHGSQISVKTLDLNLPFVEIAAQMDGIVESHFTGVIKADQMRKLFCNLSIPEFGPCEI